MRDLLIRTGEALYGERWQTPLAADLGVTDRTVRRWVSQTSPVPASIASDLLALVEARSRALVELAKALAT